MVAPRYQTATQRRQLRGKVRNALGPSSDSAPDAARATRAAGAMIDLVDLATSGRIQLRFWDPRSEAWLTPGEALKIVSEG